MQVTKFVLFFVLSTVSFSMRPAGIDENAATQPADMDCAEDAVSNAILKNDSFLLGHAILHGAPHDPAVTQQALQNFRTQQEAVTLRLSGTRTFSHVQRERAAVLDARTQRFNGVIDAHAGQRNARIYSELVAHLGERLPNLVLEYKP